jgi:chromosome segregation ATPase
MKHKHLVITFLSVAAFTTGCKPSEEKSTSQQLEKVKSETQAAAQDMKEYTFAQKAEFVAKMQGQLDALNKELDQLSAKIESSSESVKTEAKPKLQALRNEVTQLTKQLDNVRNANESTWESVKATSEKAFASLKDGFQKSREWASEKIAP